MESSSGKYELGEVEVHKILSQ